MKKFFYFLILVLFVTFTHAYGQSGKANTRTHLLTTALIDVWDFGAVQIDPTVYNNQLTVAIINGWYSSSITPGSVSTSNVFPTSFASVGGLSWTGGSNDRLRTTNTALTRYDTNIASVVGYTGRLYQNGSGTTTPTRYFTFALNEDDEVTLITKTDATGTMNFVNAATPATGQADVVAMTSDLVTLKFVAKTAGNYKIYDSSGKPSYFRIYRKPASYVSVAGTVDISQGADISAGYGVVFTNIAGKTWTATAASDNTYSINLPVGYIYSVSLANANGYVITSAKTIDLTNGISNPFNLAIKKVTLITASGSITGLGTSISKLGLTFTPDVASTYIPAPTINTSTATYTVQLEANNNYTVAATGVNDYSITDNSLVVAGTPVTKDIPFTAKPVYGITLDISSLTSVQQAALTTKFTNLNEVGYTYTFAPATTISLRDGTYAISCSGLDAYPIQLALTSNLKVNGAPTSKTLSFSPVTDWSFDDATISTTTTANYKGMQLSGTVSNDIAKGHLMLTGVSTANVPVNPGQKVIVTYYYTANFTINGGTAITTNSLSTSILETAQYTYAGSIAGFVTIANITGTTTYIPDITVVNTIPYASPITVGVDKTYQTINDALAATRAMVRPTKQRVNIMIDPGNYEEMLVVDVDSVSFINASATPTIALANQGVSIDANAVRITSYYGHGYNYFSMGTNQRWSADALRVNKENGYTNYVNTGAGTTNNSYWNTTVLVSGAGFQAANIIFENSYNQYISSKESQDVVVEWTSGGKGTRPTTMGSIAVQNKSFVERAAAISYTKSGDKSILYKCRIVGRQDPFYGAEGARVVTYKGSLMGGTDYIFGGMTLVAYKSNLALNTSEVSTDVAYITAPQQTTARGFLLDSCTVTSAQQGIETASAYLSKPGEFGRPWAATTGEAVFFHTTIETTNNPGFIGKSLIAPEGWLNTLSGTSPKCYEFGTVELSGENNQASRASWSTLLTEPTLSDATPITTFNFTKGTDNWDPLPALMAADASSIFTGMLKQAVSSVQVRAQGNKIYVSNVKPDTRIDVYGVDGSMIKSFKTNVDTNFSVNNGIWVIRAQSAEGSKIAKIIIN
jgi:exo-poly-alpha-galacturonosidase